MCTARSEPERLTKRMLKRATSRSRFHFNRRCNPHTKCPCGMLSLIKASSLFFIYLFFISLECTKKNRKLQICHDRASRVAAWGEGIQHCDTPTTWGNEINTNVQAARFHTVSFHISFSFKFRFQFFWKKKKKIINKQKNLSKLAKLSLMN